MNNIETFNKMHSLAEKISQEVTEKLEDLSVDKFITIKMLIAGILIRNIVDLSMDKDIPFPDAIKKLSEKHLINLNNYLISEIENYK